VASVFLLLVLGVEGEARADDAPRVLVVAQPPRAAVIDRALLLIRGELAGEGLAAEIVDEAPALAPPVEGVYGVLRLDASESTAVIRAFAPGDPKPIVANVDAGDAGMDAEVIAVRAVETLRAAVLQFAAGHRVGLPEAVRGFAQLPKLPATSPARRAPPPIPAIPPRAPVAQLFLGPSLVFMPHLAPNFGARGGLVVGPRWGFVAVNVDSTLYRAEVRAAAGRADISHRALSLELGARFRLARVWEITTRVGAGYASYAVSGKAEPGFVGVDVDHASAIASLAFGGAYYVGRALAVYLNLTGTVALDAPNVRIANSDAAKLDQPSFGASSGMLVTLF
jgi:hypothetical protein